MIESRARIIKSSDDNNWLRADGVVGLGTSGKDGNEEIGGDF